MVGSLGKAAWHFLMKLNTLTACDLAIPKYLLEKWTPTFIKTCTSKLRGALFIVGKNRKQLKGPSTGGRIRCIHRVINRKEPLILRFGGDHSLRRVKKSVSEGDTLYHCTDVTLSKSQNSSEGAQSRGCQGLGWGSSTRDFWGKMEMFWILMGVVITQIYTVLKYIELSPKSICVEC